MGTRTFILLAAFLLSFLAAPAHADGWFPSISQRLHLPSLFMAVDMSRQRAFLVRSQNDELKIMDAKKANPYTADPAVRITRQGVTVSLKPDGQPSRTVLFPPGNFDSWLIVSETTAP